MAIFKVNMGGPQAAGDEWTSGFHCFSAGTIDGVLSDWIGAVNTFGAAAITKWATSTQIRNVSVYQIDPVTRRATAVRRALASHVGISTGQQPDPRACIVLGLRTALPGPRYRGRMYIPAPSDDNLTATGLLTEEAQSQFAVGMSDAMIGLRAALIFPGMHHSPDIVVEPFTDVTVSQVEGTQRRRTNKIPPAYSVATI